MRVLVLLIFGLALGCESASQVAEESSQALQESKSDDAVPDELNVKQESPQLVPAEPAEKTNEQLQDQSATDSSQADSVEVSKAVVNKPNAAAVEPEVAAKETKFAENEYYVLWELPIDETSSYIRMEILKTDAQASIGVVIDIAKRIKPRGFRYFTVDDTKSQAFLVHFYKERPEGDEQVMEVDVYIALAEQDVD